jgi:hypothetical protein
MILKVFRNIKSHIRDTMIDDVNLMYDIKDSGVNGILSALSDFRSYVIVLFDNKKIIGAASYYISKKDNYIELDHIGVVERGMGYGTILVHAILKILPIYHKSKLTLVTNGYSNEFYEKLGMKRINDKLPAVYELLI